MSRFSCEHNYCPHQHYQKCEKERHRNIAYTVFPAKQIDLTGNAHIKVVNPRYSNIPTAAYQQYFTGKLEEQSQSNFVKDYYIENAGEKMKMTNQIVREYVRDTEPGNAYNLADGATKEYYIFENKRKAHLKAARQRAVNNYNQYFQQLKQQKATDIELNIKWITNLIRKLEELGRHMNGINSENADPNVADKMFLREKQGLNVGQLSKVKVSDPSAALGVIESLRALLLRKKLQFQEQRQNQQHQKSVSVSAIDASQSQNTSTVSYITAASAVQSGLGQQGLINKYCNFEELRQKWGAKNVQEVKQLVQRALAKKIISDAQGQNIKNKKQAIRNNQILKKQFKNYSGSTKQSLNKKKIQPKEQKKVNATQIIFHEERGVSKQQKQAKQALMKGGQFDSCGQVYIRNRNYSQMFSKRGEDSSFRLNFREEQQAVTPVATEKGLKSALKTKDTLSRS